MATSKIDIEQVERAMSWCVRWGNQFMDATTADAEAHTMRCLEFWNRWITENTGLVWSLLGGWK